MVKKMMVHTALRKQCALLARDYKRERGLHPYRKLGYIDSLEALEPIAKATMTSSDRVAAWLEDRSLLFGEELIRLRCYLDKCGYNVACMEGLQPEVREVTEMIYFGFVSVDLAAKKLGFGRRSDFFKVLRGYTRLGEQRLERFHKFAEAVTFFRQIVAISGVQMLEMYLDGYPLDTEEFVPPHGVPTPKSLGIYPVAADPTVLLHGVATPQDLDGEAKEADKAGKKKDRKRERDKIRKKARRREKQKKRQDKTKKK